MRLESARDLKAEFMSRISPFSEAVNQHVAHAVSKGHGSARGAKRGVTPLDSGFKTATAISAQSVESLPERQRTVAVGIAPHPNKKGDFRVAIRVQRAALLNSPEVLDMVARAPNEVDLRMIGRVVKRSAPKGNPDDEESHGRARTAALRAASLLWHQASCRPLMIGASIGHHKVTAGTLGCFVRERRGEKRVLVLSNNHVLANEGLCARGDAILQPGYYDGGRSTADDVGTLESWIKLKPRTANTCDAALATIQDGVRCDYQKLRGIDGKDRAVAGLAPQEDLEEGTIVHKVGRTTGATTGRVTAFEMENVVVNYGIGNLRFDGQIEIEGALTETFSDGGDSGSLIVDESYRAAALLFAGTDLGGANGRGLTYAHPLSSVLTNLKVDLLY